MIHNVFEIVDDVLALEPLNVTINWNKVELLIQNMEKDGSAPFFNDGKDYKTGIYIEVLKELVASSINYCYWYGASNIRPNGVSSTSMYEHVEQAFQDAKNHALNFESRIYHIIDLLSINRYPLLEERKNHLLDLCDGRKAESFVDAILAKNQTGEQLFRKMIRVFHGFASDIFLKRASLFFIQLYRKYGWWGAEGDLMSILPVPADYQIPKILKYFGCLEYKPLLEEDIYENKLIPKHSIVEIQIRAATIQACEFIRKRLNWPIADVDTYLWIKRKLTDEPFHLTISTDY